MEEDNAQQLSANRTEEPLRTGPMARKRSKKRGREGSDEGNEPRKLKSCQDQVVNDFYRSARREALLKQGLPPWRIEEVLEKASPLDENSELFAQLRSVQALLSVNQEIWERISPGYGMAAPESSSKASSDSDSERSSSSSDSELSSDSDSEIKSHSGSTSMQADKHDGDIIHRQDTENFDYFRVRHNLENGLECSRLTTYCLLSIDTDRSAGQNKLDFRLSWKVETRSILYKDCWEPLPKLFHHFWNKPKAIELFLIPWYKELVASLFVLDPVILIGYMESLKTHLETVHVQLGRLETWLNERTEFWLRLREEFPNTFIKVQSLRNAWPRRPKHLLKDGSVTLFVNRIVTGVLPQVKANERIKLEFELETGEGRKRLKRFLKFLHC